MEIVLMKTYVNYITICLVLVIASGCATSRKESSSTLVFDWNSADCARNPYEPVFKGTYLPKEYFSAPEPKVDEKPKRQKSQEGDTAYASR
jgi:hypothetical protein